MMKKLALCIAFVVGSAVFAVAMVGCDDNGTTPNNQPDLATGGGGGGNPDLSTGSGGKPDMAAGCSQSPATDVDFLNSCYPASVSAVDVVPFYPTLAPNGQLPPLQ